MQTTRYQVALEFKCASRAHEAQINEAEDLLREELCTGLLAGRETRTGWQTLFVTTSIPQACVFEAIRRIRWLNVVPDKACYQMVLGHGDEILKPVGPIHNLFLEPALGTEWDASAPSRLTSRE